MIPLATTLSGNVDKKAACSALAIPRATYYRGCRKKPLAKPRPAPPLALSAEEKETVLQIAHEERFWDASPYEMYGKILTYSVKYFTLFLNKKSDSTEY